MKIGDIFPEICHNQECPSAYTHCLTLSADMVIGGTKLDYRTSHCSTPEYCYISGTSVCDRVHQSLKSNNVSNAEVSNCVISCAPKVPPKNMTSDLPTTMCDVCMEAGTMKTECVKKNCPNGLTKCMTVSYTMHADILPKTKVFVKGCASATECQTNLEETKKLATAQKVQEIPGLVISEFKMECSSGVVYESHLFLFALGFYLVVVFTGYH